MNRTVKNGHKKKSLLWYNEENTIGGFVIGAFERTAVIRLYTRHISADAVYTLMHIIPRFTSYAISYQSSVLFPGDIILSKICSCQFKQFFRQFSN